MTITSITSQSQLDKLLSGNAYVVADFYADWCGPCKMIAPIFQQLAKEHHSPGRIQFVKIDVDGNRDVSGKYGVSA
jgi:thioredoxin 1